MQAWIAPSSLITPSMDNGWGPLLPKLGSYGGFSLCAFLPISQPAVHTAHLLSVSAHIQGYRLGDRGIATFSEDPLAIGKSHWRYSTPQGEVGTLSHCSLDLPQH